MGCDGPWSGTETAIRFAKVFQEMATQVASAANVAAIFLTRLSSRRGDIPGIETVALEDLDETERASRVPF